MEKMKRTATCGSLTAADVDRTIVLNGWVHRKRDHGAIGFVDLRDRYGITQVVVDPGELETDDLTAGDLGYEFCIAVEGVVRKRPDDMVNPEMVTGEIELIAKKLELLAGCDVLPFMVDERTEAREDLRLEYRYLDLRSFSMQRKIKLRHDVAFAVREYLNGDGFLEIETPTLIRSTPEGARDFLVPSRLHPGEFYALPQSPQLFKQILMMSGYDKYFQFPRCFRDEDARGDRQLEHTQIDIEMSFVSKEDVFKVVEGLFSRVFKSCIGFDLDTPFERISYEDAMNRFGSDKPDLRFEMELGDFACFVQGSGFKVFESVIESGGTVKALCAKGCGEYSRKMIEDLEATAKTYGAKGLAWMKVTDDGLSGGVSKFFENKTDEITGALEAKPGDLLLLVADTWGTCCTSLGAVRTRLGKDLGLTAEGFKFCWIVDFPLFEWNDEEEKWDPAHHMFTMPQERYLDTLEKDPGAVKGDLYDLVCNGLELASGSIRIHTPALQQRVFSILGITPEDAEHRFGFLLKALKYGPPPHGGIAPGFDRLLMIMTGESSIKDVIAFPKNTAGVSPMDEAPAKIDDEQLAELGLALIKREKESE